MQTNCRMKLEEKRTESGKRKQRAQWTQCGQKCNLKTHSHTYLYTHNKFKS